MVYKILILEAVIICGMLYLKFEPRVTFGKDNSAIEVTAEPVRTHPVPNRETKPVERPDRKHRTASSPALVFPVADHGREDVISVFGDKRGKTRLHKGIDVKAPRGTAVVATTDGFIERIREGGSGGRQLYLRDAAGRLFYYAHLDSWSVAEFDAVNAGDVLGTVGDTGNAKGTTPHLHFEILLGKEKKAIDPLSYWPGA